MLPQHGDLVTLLNRYQDEDYDVDHFQKFTQVILAWTAAQPEDFVKTHPQLFSVICS